MQSEPIEVELEEGGDIFDEESPPKKKKKKEKKAKKRKTVEEEEEEEEELEPEEVAGLQVSADAFPITTMPHIIPSSLAMLCSLLVPLSRMGDSEQAQSEQAQEAAGRQKCCRGHVWQQGISQWTDMHLGCLVPDVAQLSLLFAPDLPG